MKTYLEMCARPALFPVRFRYGGELIKGFGPELFQQTGRADSMEHGICRCCLNFLFDGQIVVRAETEYDPEFSAYGWTVWFENAGTEDTKVISDLVCADLVFPGGRPLLRGILGDHINQYRPYTYDLCRQDAAFRAVTGRATHVNFPYFMLETDEGTSMIAIGWAGTWEAEFRAVDAGTRLNASGVVGLKTYLKPGERIRTPQMYIVACPSPERDAQAASNHWRRWFLSRVMPRKSACSAEPVQPMITNCLASDTGRPNSDGSISEYSGSWKPSMEKYYEEGLEMDLRWVDAGWYCDAENQTVPADWWGTVGTWTLDRTKWPERSFRDSVDYAMARGTRTLLWFEPELVRISNALLDPDGIRPEWILGQEHTWRLANLGNDDLITWLINKVSGIIDKSGITIYRQDFGNGCPLALWLENDGEKRTGMTENRYVQGYLKFWDLLIARYPDIMIDSCASGGCRNDLESMRRAVPLHKTDYNYSDYDAKQAMHYTLFQWFPYFGTMTNAGPTPMTQYGLRSSFCCWYASAYDVRRREMDWDLLRAGMEEWKRIQRFYYADYYPITEWSRRDALWRGWEFFEPESGEGFIQVFRPAGSTVASSKLKLYGLEADTEYQITDLDSACSVKMDGAALMQDGLEVTIPAAAHAAVLLIAPAENEPSP